MAMRITIPQVANTMKSIFSGAPNAWARGGDRHFASPAAARMIPVPGASNFATRAMSMWGGTTVNATQPPLMNFNRMVGVNNSQIGGNYVNIPGSYSTGLSGVMDNVPSLAVVAAAVAVGWYLLKRR